MPNKRRQDFLIPLLTVLTDAVALEASFLFSYWLRFLPSFTQFIPIQYGVPPFEEYIKSSLVVIPVWLLLFQSRGLYRPRRASSFSDEFFAVVRIIIIGMIVIMAGAFLYRSFSYSRSCIWNHRHNNRHIYFDKPICNYEVRKMVVFKRKRS